MTLFKKAGHAPVYLAHPRKTGGTSLTAMMHGAGWKVRWHFDKKRIIDQPAHMTTAQYLPALDDASVTARIVMLVRHPLDRMSSLYRYSKRLEGRREQNLPPYDWWINLLMDVRDIRVTPLVDYEPPWWMRDPEQENWLLRYEDGIPHAFSVMSPGVRVKPRRLEAGLTMETPLADSTRERVIEYFRRDFETYGYDA